MYFVELKILRDRGAWIIENGKWRLKPYGIHAILYPRSSILDPTQEVRTWLDPALVTRTRI